jgi:hypothetical protein
MTKKRIQPLSVVCPACAMSEDDNCCIRLDGVLTDWFVDVDTKTGIAYTLAGEQPEKEDDSVLTKDELP